MTYDQAITFLYDQTPQFQKIGAAAYKPGLETTHLLDNCFGNPHRYYKTIHVGGTNGKGSTAHTIAAVLQSQGYKVGLYTSPHLIDFRERIRVNGKMISKEKVISFLERYESLNAGLSPSFFELTTIMAFDYFASEKVDYAVIEVGLGGRLDCTNIITPELSVITNISKDHVAQLGNTLEAIAAEKAGIIKPRVPVVIGEASGSVKEVFDSKARDMNSPIIFAPELPVAGKNDGLLLYVDDCFGEISSELTGDCQPKNASTILTALKVMKNNGCEISAEAVRAGFRNVVELTGLRGRWNKISEKPDIICDTGHNEGGWRYLSQRLKQFPSLKMVIGFVNDKDVSTILSMMPKDACYYFTKASVPRALDPETLQLKAKEYSLKGNVFETVKSALDAAKRDASESDTIFVGGSTFVVADLFDSLN